jgi:hypothetical protein
MCKLRLKAVWHPSGTRPSRDTRRLASRNGNPGVESPSKGKRTQSDGFGFEKARVQVPPPPGPFSSAATNSLKGKLPKADTDCRLWPAPPSQSGGCIQHGRERCKLGVKKPDDMPDGRISPTSTERAACIAASDAPASRMTRQLAVTARSSPRRAVRAESHSQS